MTFLGRERLCVTTTCQGRKRGGWRREGRGGGVLTKDRGGDEEHANAVLTSLIPCIQRRCIYNADNNEKCFSDEERVRFDIIFILTVKPYTLLLLFPESNAPGLFKGLFDELDSCMLSLPPPSSASLSSLSSSDSSHWLKSATLF